MKILIVTSVTLLEKPEVFFANHPVVKYFKEMGDSVSILHCTDDELYLANYVNEDNECFFQEVRTKYLYEKIKDIDVIYITNLSRLADKVLKAAREMEIPLVAEYIKMEGKEEAKQAYRSFYKYIDAIHYQNKEDQEEFEFKVVRRTNGHIFLNDDKDYLTKLRNMIIQYGDEACHTNKQKNYYSDEINDDFAINKIKIKKGKKPFKYIHKNIIWRFFEILLYYVIARPIVFLLNKIIFHQRIKNKRVLRRFRHKGYFIYANHTNGMTDAFTPNLLTRKRNYIVVSKETVSIKGIKGIVTMLGAIPIYADLDEVDAFNECIKYRILQKRSITIYPEAHIWPYYTNIRHFKKDSFRYPVELNIPVYVLTNTWQKRHFGKKPKLVSYLSGPLFPNTYLGRNEAMEDLKERVYFEMMKVTRSVRQVKKIEYIQVKK